MRGTLYYAHRLAKSLADGVAYESLVVHHLCGERLCVDPAHLQALSNGDHIRLHHPRSERCGKGHSMADAYTRPDNGYRQCRECARLRRDRRSEKAKREHTRRLISRRCVVCKCWFKPKRQVTAQYCGQRCRMAAFLARGAT